MVCRDRGLRRTDIQVVVKIVDYVSDVACIMEYPVKFCIAYVRSRSQAKWEYFIVIILTVPNIYQGMASRMGTPDKGEMHCEYPSWIEMPPFQMS